MSRAFHSCARSLAARARPSKLHHHSPIANELFPSGFVATGRHAGVKKVKPDQTEKPKDLAIIASTTQRTSSAACFTRNVFKAAPVQVSTEVLRATGGRANKVVVNSGCANAVTGSKGLEDAWSMAKETDAACTSFSPRLDGPASTLVMSTGVIGQLLPIAKITQGIRDSISEKDWTSNSTKVSVGFDEWERAAKAFMTTDEFPKIRAKTFDIPFPSSASPLTVHVAGIDKGAGMIHPNMGPPHATLLGLLVTDAPVNPSSLQSALTYAVQRSFNSISVDGDMSTNDTIIALANGAAAEPGSEELDEKRHPDAFAVFRDELTSFAAELAKLIVYDGEGATKFVTVTVINAPSYEHAHHVASTVSTSSLVKTALYGEDANWGRILCAVGYSPLTTASSSTAAPALEIDPERVSVTFVPQDGLSPLRVLVRGEPEQVDESRASEILAKQEITIEIDLGIGSESATYWTSDLTHEYVTINGDYRT